MKKKINGTIGALCCVIIFILCLRGNLKNEWYAIMIALGFGGLHLYLALVKQPEERQKEPYLSRRPPLTALTELVLLSEESDHLASWNIYGKNGVVIGRDSGENQVMVDLNHTAYASMIDVEHAVLNFSGENWYIEDISNRNGVSIQKRDGKKYKLSYGKPCRLEGGDIIFIALTRLQIL